MKKKGIFLISIIFLLALMPGAFSIYSESVYSGTVEDGDTVNITGHIFEFKIDSVSSKVYIAIDISGIIVSSGECKIKDNFNICITNISTTFKRNNITGLRIYKALLEVSQIKSSIEITNTIEKSSLLIGEETIAELAIENTADVVAEDVTATINIPSSVLVTDVEGCKKTFENIIFNEDVYPRQIKKCTYKIKGLTGDDFELTANITYFDGIEKKSVTSSTISGKVYNYSLKISSKLNKSKFSILEKFDFTVDIENTNDQYGLTITTFNMKLPEKLLIVKRPRDTVGTSRIISWSGTLEAGEKVSLVSQLQSLRTGNYSIPISASYKISTFSRSAKSASNIEIYCDCPYISHDFSQQIAVPEQRVTLKVLLTNPNSVLDFRNVKIDYVASIPNIQDFSTAYASIKPSESINIFNSPIITPPLNEIYYLNVTAVYELSGNQIFVVKDKIAIKVPGWEEETTDAEEAEVEEQQESEEVSLIPEKPEEEIDELQEKDVSEEIPLTTLQDEGKKPIKALTIMAYIAALIFILIMLLIFKRKKHEKAKEQKDTKDSDVAEEKKQIIKEALSNIFKGVKENIKRRFSGNKKEESEYRQLEREIQSLGKISKKK